MGAVWVVNHVDRMGHNFKYGYYYGQGTSSLISASSPCVTLLIDVIYGSVPYLWVDHPYCISIQMYIQTYAKILYMHKIHNYMFSALRLLVRFRRLGALVLVIEVQDGVVR
jgi:hypothetical protein